MSPPSLPQTLPLFPDDWPIEPSAEASAEPTREPSGLTVDVLLTELKCWVEAGWLRQLDWALARLIAEQAPGTAPAVLLLVALLAQMESRGHTCLRLPDLLDPTRRAAWLTWPPAALAALDAVLRRLPAALTVASAVSSTAASTLPSNRRAEAAQRAWLALLGASAAVDDGAACAARGHAPLVRDADRLYLRRHWRDEQRVATQVLARSRLDRAEGADAADAPVATSGLTGQDRDPARVRTWLDLLFGPLPAPARAAADRPTDPQLPSDADLAAIDWQRLACAAALRGRLTLITGGPGTGKTYTVARLLVLVHALHHERPAAPLRIALAAPTGKAAARLKQAIEQALAELRAPLQGLLSIDALTQSLGSARTLHSLLGARPDTRRLRHDARQPLDVDLLVVDEASMVHLEMMAGLLDALPAAARLVLLGDKDQLASVEAGAVLGDLCRGAEQGAYRPDMAAALQALSGIELPPRLLDPAGRALAQQTVMLRRSRRFAGPIGALANAVNRGDGHAARQVLLPERSHRRVAGEVVRGVVDTEATVAARLSESPQAVVELALRGREQAPGGYAVYARLLAERPADDEPAAHAAWVVRVLRAFERFRVLAALRDGDWGVAGLNRAIEQALVQARLLRRHGEWYEGRPVMVTRNDPATGVHNGDVGLALWPARQGALRVWFLDGDQLRSVLASRLAQVETAFAMTVHKSQGSEFEHTVLVLPPQASAVLTRELVYTGITRARQAFTLVATDLEVFGTALARRTVRASGLPELLSD